MPEPALQTEKYLFLRISQGDEQAFEELFHLYVPRLQPVIKDVIRNEAHVKDVMQEIFLDLWTSRIRLPEIEIPRNWIFRITYNRSYQWVSRQLARNKAAAGLEASQTEEVARHLTAEQFSFTETSRLIKEAIRMLAPQSQRIYRMSREEGLKPSEIAVLLDISAQSVKNSLQRSNISIRDFLLKKGIHVPVLVIALSVQGIIDSGMG